MRRPSNDAWFEKQACGPLFVYFSVDSHHGEVDEVLVNWCICPDDEDKSEERAFAGSDWEIRGPKDKLDALIDRAMREASEAALRIAAQISAWAELPRDAR